MMLRTNRKPPAGGTGGLRRSEAQKLQSLHPPQDVSGPNPTRPKEMQ